MAWLHTWAGVGVSALLFAIIWMGSLSVFDREIDRWMAPMTRLPGLSEPPLLDAAVVPVVEKLAGQSALWILELPSERTATLRLFWRDTDGKNHTRHLDPVRGALLPDAGSHAGTGFIYPFHFRLHISFMDIGYWLVGFAAMAMLVAIVSGVVVHKKIFRDFFTFRPRKHTQRAALDLHNLTGVLAMPFHFVIALSGLMIFFAIYFPSAWQVAYPGNKQAFNNDARDSFQRGKARQRGELGSLDAMLAQARRAWGSGEVSQVRMHHPGDANAYVEVRRSPARQVTRDTQSVYFDAASGVMLARSQVRPAKSVLNFVTGLHMVQFSHWTLRWLYFLAGLTGCVMLATGLLVWLEARRVQHAKQGLTGVRVVEALAVAAVPGIMLATCAFFVVNRLLPLGASFAGGTRAELEMWAFYLAWGLSLAHAAWRGRSAWAEQSAALSVLALAAVLLNWFTTGDHLLRTLGNADFAIAGMDSLLLLGAATAAWAARGLHRRAARQTGAPAPLLGRRADYA